jgi:hypothetical protein
MSDVFRPRLGGDGDGDGLVAAMTGWRDAVTIGGGGDSRKSIGSACVVRDSNADILAWTDIILQEQGQNGSIHLACTVAGIVLTELIIAGKGLRPIPIEVLLYKMLSIHLFVQQTYW